MTRRTPGFSLVEVIFATALVSLIIGAAMMMFNLSDKSRVVTGAAEALQAAVFFQERFETDLRTLAFVRHAPVRFWPPAGGQARKQRIAFYMHDLARDQASVTEPKMGALAVVYDLTIPAGSKTAFPTRKVGNGSPESIGASPFTSLAFNPFLGPTGPVVRVTAWVAREKDKTQDPIVHSFLARIPTPSAGEIIRLDPIEDFANADDKPVPVDLPSE